jgi:hypothetical protein
LRAAWVAGLVLCASPAWAQTHSCDRAEVMSTTVTAGTVAVSVCLEAASALWQVEVVGSPSSTIAMQSTGGPNAAGLYEHVGALTLAAGLYGVRFWADGVASSTYAVTVQPAPVLQPCPDGATTHPIGALLVTGAIRPNRVESERARYAANGWVEERVSRIPPNYYLELRCAGVR